jgi:hypothetical protein
VFPVEKHITNVNRSSLLYPQVVAAVVMVVVVVVVEAAVRVAKRVWASF